MRCLLDTNVLSELRKGDRTDASVATWFGSVPGSDVYLSVVVLGEVRKGIEGARRRDPRAAEALDRWLAAVISGHAGRILPVDQAVADLWGRLNVPDPMPTIDGLLAATALVHDMTLVTRNTKDVARSGVALLNPFEARQTLI